MLRPSQGHAISIACLSLLVGRPLLDFISGSKRALPVAVACRFSSSSAAGAAPQRFFGTVRWEPSKSLKLKKGPNDVKNVY
jgi:hypothetical protein